GLFLNADKLGLEQAYVMQLAQLANQAGGSGIVYGFDTTISMAGDQITLGPGFAIDPQGRPLLLQNQIQPIPIQTILDSAAQVTQQQQIQQAGTFGQCDFAQMAPPGDTSGDVRYWILYLAHAEAACGNEPVFGKLCEEACITTNDRPYFRE